MGEYAETLALDPTARKPWTEQLDEAGTRLEEELRRVVRYLDDEVVPELRRNGSAALRTASTRLRELAEHLDDHRASSPTPPATGSAPPRKETP